MPATYSYPGVYIEEIPSGVRTIAGVSTSDTAFVHFFKRGPVDQAVRITSYAAFERMFGGLDPRSEASYAIMQYYLNGGQVAWVIRVTTGTADPAELPLNAGYGHHTLTVRAANPGGWGNNLQVAVVQVPGAPDRFNLVVREVVTQGGRQQVVNTETHLNLTMSQTDRRYAVDVVNSESNLVSLEEAGLGETPIAAAPTASGGVPESAFQPLTGGTDGNTPDSNTLIGSPSAKTGIYALDLIDPFIFNILCLPAAATLDVPGMASAISRAEAYCEAKRAFLLVDIPPSVNEPSEMTSCMASNDTLRHRNAAVYFPRFNIPDPLNDNRPRDVGPSGTLAGIYARTDTTRGIWKAPAGTDASLRGVTSLVYKMTDAENGELNPQGVNALRTFPIYGNVSWGARTLEGSDQAASEWKYIPIRRLAVFIEESLFQGTKWVVFEPNDEPLWAQIRLNVGAFMHSLFTQGAFQGQTPRDAYFVKCDHETNPQNDIDRGIVNIVVGFAPLKPAEFVVIKIQQIAGEIQA